MKTKKFISLAVIFLSLLSLSGCGKKKIDSWAYDHEPDKEILAFYQGDRAVFKGEEYTYREDDTSITILDKNQDMVVHCAKDGNSIILYEKTSYTRNSGDASNGIVGLWTQDNGWSYEFTDEGRFSEDAIFFGRYSVDEKAQCIRLMYDDPIQDAYLYYSLEGDDLMIDYPWPLVRTKGSFDESGQGNS